MNAPYASLNKIGVKPQLGIGIRALLVWNSGMVSAGEDILAVPYLMQLMWQMAWQHGISNIESGFGVTYF